VAPGLNRVHPLLVGASVTLLLLVGASRPNAAQPDLSPSGWAPGPLIPVTLGPGAVTAALWTAYGVGALAVLLGLRVRPDALRTWAVPTLLAGLALLTAPFGSGDHVNYIAYGRILVGGGDPWVEAPVEWAGGDDPVTSRVEEPWTTEPSVYGPFGTMLHGLSGLLGGDSLRQGVWVWQLLVVISWLAVRALLRAVLAADLHGRVDVLWTLNPLVFGIGVLGAHIDMAAAALAVLAVAAAARRQGALGAAVAGGCVALAGSTKATYAVVGLALGAAWWLTGHRGVALGRLVAPAVAAGTVVAGALHAWAGPHVLDQLMRSRQAVSLATPWRPVLEWARDRVDEDAARLGISIAAAVVAVVLAACLVRASRPAVRTPSDLLVDRGTGSGRVGRTPSDLLVDRGTFAAVALWVTACLALAYSLAAPYSLPWYDLLVWCALPAVAPGLVDLVALARLTAAAVAYVPGRVLGMTPGVEELTLGVRRGVAPWVAVLLWVIVIAAGARTGSRRPSGPRPAGRTSPPTR
jgi:hypothetical protein